MNAYLFFRTMTIKLAGVLLFMLMACGMSIACPAGIGGFSNPHATVCARDSGGTLWCTAADSSGNFNLSGAQSPSSTSGAGCLPETGNFFVYDIDCPTCGVNVVHGSTQVSSSVYVKCACQVAQCVPPPNTTMIAWYPFDEFVGPIGLLKTGNLATNNPGTLINGPTSITGKVARALSFDGINDYVESPSTIITNIGSAPAPAPSNCYSCPGNFSIDAWIKVHPSASQALLAILDKHSGIPPAINGYSLFVYQQNQLGLKLADGGGATGYNDYLSPILSPLLTDGLWHHVAVTVVRRNGNSPGMIRWYHNGNLVRTSSTTRFGSLVNNSPLRIGAQLGLSQLTSWFKGSIDELEIFNRALSPGEVAGLFNAGPSGKCKPPRVIGPNDVP